MVLVASKERHGVQVHTCAVTFAETLLTDPDVSDSREENRHRRNILVAICLYRSTTNIFAEHQKQWWLFHGVPQRWTLALLCRLQNDQMPGGGMVGVAQGGSVNVPSALGVGGTWQQQHSNNIKRRKNYRVSRHECLPPPPPETTQGGRRTNTGSIDVPPGPLLMINSPMERYVAAHRGKSMIPAPPVTLPLGLRTPPFQ